MDKKKLIKEFNDLRDKISYYKLTLNSMESALKEKEEALKKIKASEKK